MKKNLKTACAKVTAVALALAMVASAAPADAAKAKKPALSTTKATITVGKTKKITVKKAKPKKTTWTVNKKGKKIVKLTKKKKTSVTIKALKKGSATVTAKIKVGKKNYTKKVKVTVNPKTTPAKSAAPSKAPVSNAPASQAPASKAPVSNAPASKAPVSEAPASKAPVSEAPASEEPEVTPTPEPTPLVPEGNEFKMVPSADNQWTAVGDSYYSDLTFPEGEGAVFTSTNAYNSCVAFYLADGLTVDVSDFDTLEVDLVCAFDQFEPGNSVAKEAALKVWNTGATNFWGKADGAYEGDPTKKEPPQGADRIWEIPLSTLVKNGVNLSDIKAIGAVVNNAEGDQVKVRSFTFKKDTGNFVSKDIPKAISIKQAESLTKVEEGNTLDLVATVTNKNGATLDTTVNWTSDAEDVATVENGTVTGVKAGKAKITATVEGYDDVKATYDVEVFNNDPASIAIQVENNYKVYTVEELLAQNEGMAVKGVLLNANGDVVGDTTSQNITVKDAGTTGAQIDEGVLTATAAGTLTLELEATDTFEAVELSVPVVDGYRVPLTVDNVYKACQDSSDVAIADSVVTIKDIANYNNGIGFKMTLPESVTVADIKGVMLYASTTQSGVTQVAPYAPLNSFDNDVKYSTAADWAEAQAFGTGVNIEADGPTTVLFDKASTGLDTSGSKISFSIGFTNQNTGAISASDVILLKETE